MVMIPVVSIIIMMVVPIPAMRPALIAPIRPATSALISVAGVAVPVPAAVSISAIAVLPRIPAVPGSLVIIPALQNRLLPRIVESLPLGIEPAAAIPPGLYVVIGFH